MRRIHCAEVWGGIRDIEEDVVTSGVKACLFSGAAVGGRGGDIYFLSVCSSNALTRIALADVVGHGDAVAVTSQWMYHAIAERMNCLDGNGILEHLNRLSDEYGMEALTTAAVISYYKENSNLYFSYAGHPPILIQRSESRVWEPLALANPSYPGNLPFGVDVQATYDQQQVALVPGDRFFLFTDGVIEAPGGDGALFGFDRLVALLRDVASEGLSTVRSAVLAGLRRHTGGGLGHDDVTFLVVEVT